MIEGLHRLDGRRSLVILNGLPHVASKLIIISDAMHKIDNGIKPNLSLQRSS